VVLANCPLHALARQHTALVRGMNLHLLTAMLDALGRFDVQTRASPGTAALLGDSDRRAGLDRSPLRNEFQRV
jgi:hypothetical protein